MATDRSRRRPSNAADIVEQILERIRDSRGFDFRNYKRPTLHRRIERQMAERKCKTAAEYLVLLDRDPAEYDALIASMLIKVTGFFRDSETWTLLSEKWIPQLLSEKRPGEELRVWCAASATGEEAFSIAILLAEAMGPAFQNQEVKIVGTDADEKAIAFARRGVYSREQVKSVPPEMLKTWFVEDPTGWSVRKEIRRAVVFGVNNLVSDAPISRLDLLLCRNVFIYMDSELQKRVLTRFYYALRRNGIIVLGKSELIPFAAKLFEPVDLARRIYRKNALQLSVEVSPLRNVGREIIGLLYTVHDVTQLRELEDELRMVSSEKQNAYEELQTINEELQSSNEELETTNEELQSANEEL